MEYRYPFIFVLTLMSCNNHGPSPADVQQKMMLELVCAGSAKITHFEIASQDKIKDASQRTVYRYLVRGQVSWPDGCEELGSGYVHGREQSFEQTVFLSKNKNGQFQ